MHNMPLASWLLATDHMLKLPNNIASNYSRLGAFLVNGFRMFVFSQWVTSKVRFPLLEPTSSSHPASGPNSSLNSTECRQDCQTSTTLWSSHSMQPPPKWYRRTEANLILSASFNLSSLTNIISWTFFPNPPVYLSTRWTSLVGPPIEQVYSLQT